MSPKMARRWKRPGPASEKTRMHVRWICAAATSSGMPVHTSVCCRRSQYSGQASPVSMSVCSERVEAWNGRG